MIYRLSYTALAKAPCLVRRPWWKFWGRDSIGWTKDWNTVEMHGLSQRQSDQVKMMDADPELNELLYKLLSRQGDEILHLGIFAEDANGNYVPPEPMRKPPQLTPWRPNTGEKR